MNYIDLFAGAGGLSEGFIREGFNPIAHVEMNKEAADTLKKVAKQVTDEIKAIRETLNGKTQDKQGYGQVPQVTVSGTLQEARGNILGKNVAPSAQEERLVAEAEQQVNELISKANTFFTTTWIGYQKLVEASPVKLFKEYKNIE